MTGAGAGGTNFLVACIVVNLLVGCTVVDWTGAAVVATPLGSFAGTVAKGVGATVEVAIPATGAGAGGIELLVACVVVTPAEVSAVGAVVVEPLLGGLVTGVKKMGAGAGGITLPDGCVGVAPVAAVDEVASEPLAGCVVTDHLALRAISATEPVVLAGCGVCAPAGAGGRPGSVGADGRPGSAGAGGKPGSAGAGGEPGSIDAGGAGVEPTGTILGPIRSCGAGGAWTGSGPRVGSGPIRSAAAG